MLFIHSLIHQLIYSSLPSLANNLQDAFSVLRPGLAARQWKISETRSLRSSPCNGENRKVNTQFSHKVLPDKSWDDALTVTEKLWGIVRVERLGFVSRRRSPKCFCVSRIVLSVNFQEYLQIASTSVIVKTAIQWKTASEEVCVSFATEVSVSGYFSEWGWPFAFSAQHPVQQQWKSSDWWPGDCQTVGTGGLPREGPGGWVHTGPPPRGWPGAVCLQRRTFPGCINHRFRALDFPEFCY